MGPRDPRNGPIVEGLADRPLKDMWLESRGPEHMWLEDRLLVSEDSMLVSEGSRLEVEPMDKGLLVAVDCCNRTGVAALVRKYALVVRRSVRFRKAVTNRVHPALKPGS